MVYVDGRTFQGIFPLNKHETLSNSVRLGIYFNGKLCLRNIDLVRK